ncbi:hypothetical protein DSO57_1003010 [Entomophthora muscae]|uniref:Uncharacterized protein n=1 Tax=Entomophthora muscae TaxID=34485 RepID=A0ACC2SYB8_9FUNG|nr:hypothetical protein DSO57_1003010 [Entomophthora muscae]
MFKAVFLVKFSMKHLDVVIMTKLQTFKMTGTIKEYIAAYEGLHDQAPNTINFDEPGPHLDFYNGLPTHIRRHFDMTCCKNLKDVFLEGKCAVQKSDNLHATNKRKENPAAKREPRPNKQNNEPIIPILELGITLHKPTRPALKIPKRREKHRGVVVIHMSAVLQARVDLASNKDNMLKSDNVWLAGDAVN